MTRSGTTTSRRPPGALLWLTAGEERHGLGFVVSPFTRMGLIGILLSGAGSLRQAWVQELAQLRRSRSAGGKEMSCP